jgi:hypothetical protein
MRLSMVLSLGLPALLAGVPSRGDDPRTPPASESLVALDLGGRAEVVWPYTSAGLSDVPSDPLNLVFVGEADPRRVRAALFALDGNRTAFGLPDVFPFNCTWADAIGRQQAGYAEEEGWQGSAIQLQCGEYDTLRVHMRMFRQGDFTLANAHFEVLIPGTTDHEVLSWEFSQQLVTLDLVRSGLLGAARALTGPITPTPTYRAIRPEVFNGLPAALRGALGLPTTPQTAPVPIPNDGRAAILRLAIPAAIEPGLAEREFVHPFNQTIPKPFCSAGPLDYLKVEGPIDMRHRVTVSDEGHYKARFDARGTLQVTPVDPRTGVATGAIYTATIRERHESSVGENRTRAGHDVLQVLDGDPVQAYVETLKVGAHDVFVRLVECGS